jgi:hypothetical protein
MASETAPEVLTGGETNLSDKALPLCTSAPTAGFTKTSYYQEPKEEDHDDEEEDDSVSSTTWDVIVTLYLPIILLWLRRSMFGTANLIRYLLLGHFLRLLLKYLAPSQDGHPKAVAPWRTSLATWLQQRAATGTSTGATSTSAQSWLQPFAGGTSAQTWPPPAFTILALLTFVAFVAHPDGFTWIMLAKLRYVFVSPSSLSLSTNSSLSLLYFISLQRQDPIFRSVLNNLLLRYGRRLWNIPVSTGVVDVCGPRIPCLCRRSNIDAQDPQAAQVANLRKEEEETKGPKHSEWS